MKSIPYFFLIFSALITVSCQDEILTPEIHPCDSIFLSELQADTTIVINCLLDLEGETIELPANVHIDFDGGDIINGKLVFSGGTIDGRLLSSKLLLSGDFKLKESTFKFIPDRWESIVEGETSSDVALKNTSELERLMYYTKSLGATVFEIGEFDAFFEVSILTSASSNQVFHPYDEAVNIPADYHLKMSDQTHLRVFPGIIRTDDGALLAISDVANTKISGGNLHGDRDIREYPEEENSEVGNNLILIRSGVNVVIDGINIENGSAGGLDINSFGFSFNYDYRPTTNVVIKNCVFRNNRAMSLVVTDGREIEIVNNEFINAAMPSTNSDGGVVGYAINLEPVRTRDADGNLREFQKVFDVLIQGNTETNSRIGFLTITIGQNITVTDNDIETKVAYGYTSGTKITGNRFNASGKSKEGWAIFASGEGETVYDNEVSDNIISGYTLGIAVSTKDVQVRNNTITDCNSGIQLQETFDSRIENNNITASSNGITATNTFNNNVEVSDNDIAAGDFLLYLINLNNNEAYEDYRMTFLNNRFLKSPKPVSISRTNGIIFSDNEVSGSIEMANASNVTVSSNTLRPSHSDGIELNSSQSFVSITDNTIYRSNGYECVRNNSTTPSGVTLSNNTCN